MNKSFKKGDTFIAKNNTIFSPGKYYYNSLIYPNTIELITEKGRKVHIPDTSLLINFDLSLETKLDFLIKDE